MSTNKISAELLSSSVDKILAFASGSKSTGIFEPLAEGQKVAKEVPGVKRNFQETIELQVSLKNYDVNKDKRFTGVFRLPAAPRPRLSICVLGSEDHIKKAKDMKDDKVEAQSQDDLKKLNKNKKLVKKLARKYDAFLASHTLIKAIPRLLGPGLNRANKFPAVINAGDDLQDKVDETRSQVKFALKKVLCLSAAVAHVGMSKENVVRNIVTSTNFLASLLKKNWQNLGAIYIKSTMGPAQQIYF